MKELLSTYKIPIIILLSILVISSLYFGGKHIYNSIYESGYSQGKQEEKEANLAAQNIAKQEADKDRQKLNSDLDLINKKYQDLLSKRDQEKYNNSQLLKKYSSEKESLNKCLDDKFIDIYNGGLIRLTGE